VFLVKKTFCENYVVYGQKLKFNDEAVKAKDCQTENKEEHDDELHWMFVKIVVGLTVCKLASDNCTYKQGQEEDCQEECHKVLLK